MTLSFFYGIVRYSANVSLVHLLAPSCVWFFPPKGHVGSGLQISKLDDRPGPL